ncbi:MAG: GIY-YIG nuclease family protein [Ignavibacteriae bacterium]|nr:GIY-YIG nuclease family protein [Ignavibacteriota bacterium]
MRLVQHQRGEGANHTKARLPVTLVYCEEYARIDEAYYREKQVQGWSRKKKEALIQGNPELLPELAKNYTQFPRKVSSTGRRLSLSKSPKLDTTSTPQLRPRRAGSGRPPKSRRLD